MYDDMAALKAAGKIDEHNAMAVSYNSLMDEHNAMRRTLDEQTELHNTILEQYNTMTKSFKTNCQDKRIFKPDLKKACAVESAASGPFCKGATGR